MNRISRTGSVLAAPSLILMAICASGCQLLVNPFTDELANRPAVTTPSVQVADESRVERAALQRPYKPIEVAVVDETLRRVPPGTMLGGGGKQPPVVAAMPGAVAILRVQCENARPQDGIAFCCGRRVQPGDRLRGHPVEPGDTDRA